MGGRRPATGSHRRLVAPLSLLVLAAACGSSDTTDAFCGLWEDSLAQGEVVSTMDVDDANYSVEVQRLIDINTELYDNAPDDIRAVGQRLANLGASGESEGTEELTAILLTYVAENC